MTPFWYKNALQFEHNPPSQEYEVPTTSSALLMPDAELALLPFKTPTSINMPKLFVKNAWLRPSRLKVPAITPELLIEEAVASRGAPGVVNEPFVQRNG
jgi:hypothetical protein